MSVSNRPFRLLTASVGTVLALGGAGLLALFPVFLATGFHPLADVTGGDPLGALILSTVGALAFPLGAALFLRPTSALLRLTAVALGGIALLRLLAMASPEIRAVVGNAPLVEFIVLGGVAALCLWLRPAGESPIELRSTFDVDAPAERVWHVLAEQFADVGAFARGVRSSVMDGPVGVGAVRTCESEAFGPFASSRVTEELVTFSPEAMRFTYVAGGELPRFIPSSTNRWSVESLGVGRSRVSSHASIDLVWWAVPFAPLLGFSIGSAVTTFGEDLRHRVEQGVPHPGKSAA
ncbi:MAG: SRPBCC family protein [Myxococcales bacterium]|nr:SRPBCC family protein [Myxococcales bacterium]